MLTIRGTARNGDQLPKDSIFKLQLDTVRDWFKHNLHGIISDIFDNDDGDIQDQNDDVDNEQLVQNALWTTSRSETKQFHRFPDIDAGNNQFLHAETDQLDALHDIVCAGPETLWMRNGAVQKDRRRDLEYNGIDADHPQHTAQ